MISLLPIATVQSPRHAIEDDHWGKVVSTIELLHPYGADALDHLDDFSHAEIVFYFHQVEEEKIETGARHPRNNPDWPVVGIFAQRGKNRPNRIGVTIVKILRREGRSLYVEGLDAIDGTPVLDIKPVMQEFLPRDDIRQPTWATELMQNYW